MPTPRLLHRVPVFLRKKDPEETPVWDDNLKEPVGQLRRKRRPVKLYAQIGKGMSDRQEATEGGRQLKGDGYLLFLTRELKAAKVEVEEGDRVVQIGEGDSERQVDYYITRLDYRGHYPEYFGHTMVKAYFEDRESSRVRR